MNTWTIRVKGSKFKLSEYVFAHTGNLYSLESLELKRPLFLTANNTSELLKKLKKSLMFVQ